MCALPLWRVLPLVAASTGFLVLQLPAQDVTVGEPQWIFPSPPPNDPPAVKLPSRIPYPEEMTGVSAIGYVAINRTIDEAGKVAGTTVTGSNVMFQRAVETPARRATVAAAQRDGVPVTARCFQAVIFNPKSAGSSRRDATPRLLAVTPVQVVTNVAARGEPPVVFMKLSLDAAGAITQAEPDRVVTPRNLAAIREALRKWRFAPARNEGSPVAAEVTVPVICQLPFRLPGTKSGQTGAGVAAKDDYRPARVVSQSMPRYPAAMRRHGISGEVMVDLEVTAEGRVASAVVFQSENPAFDDPALDAVLQWKFEPATRNGVPTATKMRVPMVFHFNEGEDKAYRVRAKADQSKLPPEFRYDTPPRVRAVLVPVYPYQLRRDGVRGTAKAVMAVDARGQVSQVKIMQASHPEFGDALAAALEGFRFQAAHREGKPVPTLVTFEQSFDARELPDEPGDQALGLEKRNPEKILPVSQLDAPLNPVSRRAPVFPLALSDGVTNGEAVVECLIDAEGRVRLPRIKSATSNAFGYAAVQAANAWRFQPPRAAGKPVMVRAMLPFKFTSLADGASAAKKK
jgi:TonB family protein